MNWIDFLSGFIRTYEAVILLVLSLLVVCLLALSLYLLSKVGRLARSRRSTAAAVVEPPGGNGADLARRLGRSEEEVVLLGERQNVLDERLALSLQRVGLVRFDAFPDVGGEQSFALALLDREMNGVVLSNLYSRTDCRLYAKEVAGGGSQHTLSEEEKEAIRRAGTLRM